VRGFKGDTIESVPLRGSGQSPEKKWGTKRTSVRLISPQARFSLITAFKSYDWFKDKQFLEQEYLANQKSAAQIAREIGCAPSTISKHLLENGIQPRHELLPNYRKSQLRYGEKIYRGQVVDHLGEMEIINELRTKRCSEGLSFGKLAQ